VVKAGCNADLYMRRRLVKIGGIVVVIAAGEIT